jgi:XTP/dITP diphosphohydrolase
MSFPDAVALASRNPGKIREILAICSEWPVRWMTADRDPGPWPEVDETGTTYLENARLKAEALTQARGMASLADDSGIEVDALGGAPGPRSARFAGEHASDRENLDRLIELIRDVPPAGRGARYRCVAVLILPDRSELVGEGTCEGTLIVEPRGSGGFGYDPIFVPAGGSQTMAELGSEEKNRISHRGRALRALGAGLSAAS